MNEVGLGAGGEITRPNVSEYSLYDNDNDGMERRRIGIPKGIPMQTNQKIKQNKVLMTICLDKIILEKFKITAQKDMRKYSNLIEGYIRRYVQSKT